MTTIFSMTFPRRARRLLPAATLSLLLLSSAAALAQDGAAAAEPQAFKSFRDKISAERAKAADEVAKLKDAGAVK